MTISQWQRFKLNSIINHSSEIIDACIGKYTKCSKWERKATCHLSFGQIKANQFFHKEKNESPSCDKHLLQDYSASLSLQSLVMSLSEKYKLVLINSFLSGHYMKNHWDESENTVQILNVSKNKINFLI